MRFCSPRHGIPVSADDLRRDVKRQFWAPYRVVRVVSNITLAQMADLVADPEFPRQVLSDPRPPKDLPGGEYRVERHRICRRDQ